MWGDQITHQTGEENSSKKVKKSNLKSDLTKVFILSDDQWRLTCKAKRSTVSAKHKLDRILTKITLIKSQWAFQINILEGLKVKKYEKIE